MARGAEALVSMTWSKSGTREVYSDFNAMTLQITTDALFGFTPSDPQSKDVTGRARGSWGEQPKTGASVLKCKPL